MVNIRSNAMRGDYMRNIVDRTINEIHDNLVTVFGPFAADAYLTMNGQPYYTRDGKETIRLMRFDNELSMYILKIMYQAVQQQGEKVGDGTTTLAVLYTNLYKCIREYLSEHEVPISRHTWNTAIKKINEAIKKESTALEDTDLIQMLFTCTQDEELSAKIYHNLKQPIMDNAYITINKSNIESDFIMTSHNAPLFKATRQFSVFPVKSREERCVILHCNGILDITHVEVFLDLMSRVTSIDGKDFPKTVVLLANGITEATRRTVKELVQQLNIQKGDRSIEEAFKGYNNVAIYTLDEYRKYDAQMIEDISTIITDENGIGGLVNQVSFESLVYQSLCNPENQIKELMTFDCDMHHLTKMVDIFNAPYPMEFDDVLGIRLHKPLGPVATNRYNELRKEIEEEKSGVKRIELMKRLRTMYGQFIEVEVGSKMMKDSQRKYELILDAVLSASEAVEKGVLRSNSLLVAHKAIYELRKEITAVEPVVYNLLLTAIERTMIDMLHYSDFEFNIEGTEAFHAWYADADIRKFNLHTDDSNCVLPKNDIADQICMPLHTVRLDPDSDAIEFEERIIEPVSIITTMLENSTLILELAQSRTFQLEGFMDNYIGT